MRYEMRGHPTMTINRSHRQSRRRLPQASARVLPQHFNLEFAAFYTYSPRGESEVSRRSRQLCGRVKNGSASWLKSYSARVICELARNGRFDSFFDDRATLVPVPECHSSNRASRWIARRLAVALGESGLGDEVWTGLRRISSVERSASAWIWERPTVQQHYESFAVIPLSTPPSEIVLVDDVVTKGRTLVAAAIRLSEAFPSAKIRAFALIRTMGLVFNVNRLFDPCRGEIRWNGKDAYRDP